MNTRQKPLAKPYTWYIFSVKQKAHACLDPYEGITTSLCGYHYPIDDANHVLPKTKNCKRCERIIKLRYPKQKEKVNTLGWRTTDKSQYNHFFHGRDDRNISVSKCNDAQFKQLLKPVDYSKKYCPICLMFEAITSDAPAQYETK